MNTFVGQRMYHCHLKNLLHIITYTTNTCFISTQITIQIYFPNNNKEGELSILGCEDIDSKVKKVEVKATMKVKSKVKVEAKVIPQCLFQTQ